MGSRVILALSDIEMGHGGPEDDFPHDDLLAEILAGYEEVDGPVDVVFNGDTFDFLKTPVDGAYPLHITRDVALAKTTLVAAAHRDFLGALDRFTRTPDHRVHFVLGNHDAELLFPEVQALLRQLCGGSEQIQFPGYRMRMGPVHIEHGSQGDPMFAMDEDRPFVGPPDDPILNQSWGTLGMLYIASPLQDVLYQAYRLRPRERLFEIVPEARRLLLKRSWTYWSREFWHGFSDDPLKHVTWPMVKEIAYRFATADADVNIADRYRVRLRESDARLWVVGHRHRPLDITEGNVRLLVTPCMRDEYLINGPDRPPLPMTKGGVHVRLEGDSIVDLATPTYSIPPRPDAPGPPETLRPVFASLLAEYDGRDS